MAKTLEIVQREADELQSAAAYGASIFSGVSYFLNDKREYYRDEYLHSEHWANLRARKLAVNPSCEKCQSSEPPNVHHKDYRNLYDVTVSDLMSLCRRCHDAAHVLLKDIAKSEWKNRMRMAAGLLECDTNHIEAILAIMGVTPRNMRLMDNADVFKIGLIFGAFERRPKPFLRMVHLVLSGKRQFFRTRTAEPSDAVAA